MRAGFAVARRNSFTQHRFFSNYFPWLGGATWMSSVAFFHVRPPECRLSQARTGAAWRACAAAAGGGSGGCRRPGPSSPRCWWRRSTCAAVLQCGGAVLWMDEILHHHRRINISGFLRWCRISFIHSMAVAQCTQNGTLLYGN